MNPARSEATKYALQLLSKFAGKNEAVSEIETMLNALSDKEFDQYMHALQNEEEIIPYVAPNLGKVRLSVERNLELAKELGHEFFEQLWLMDDATGETYLTPHKYLVVDLPFRRLQQHLQKKIKIPGDSSVVDDLTGQLTGSSKGSRLSFPELQVLYSQGLDQSIRELFKFRGGDAKAYNELTREIISGGVSSMDAVDSGDTRAKSIDVLKVLLKSAHLDNNL